MNVSVMTLGGLECQVVDHLPQGGAPRLLVVLCHGFGAPGGDLVPLAPELLNRASALADRVQFVFPAAPLRLDAHGLAGGRAWWLLDLERRLMAIEQGRLRDLIDERPAGLPEARGMLTELLRDAANELGVPVSNVVLGGFSQGAMVSTDVALRLEERPAGLCILSGTLLCESEWRALAARRGPLPVLQSHGTRDPLLPYDAAVWLRDLLQEGGLPVEFVPFEGPHTIAGTAVARMAALLERLAAE